MTIEHIENLINSQYVLDLLLCNKFAKRHHLSIAVNKLVLTVRKKSLISI